jgi:VanZ family protein
MRRWLPFLIFSAFLSTVIYAADRQLARGFFGWVQTIPLGDKLGHFVLMGTLAFLLNTALKRRRIWPGVQLGGVIAAVFVVGEEISQRWMPWRTFDYGDLLADFLGIALADWLSRRFPRQHRG